MNLRHTLIALLTLVISTLSLTGFAQDGKVTGTVLDAKDGYPLTGATVRIEGTNLGAITDIDGKYVIQNVPTGTYTVIISYVSYLTRRIENVKITKKDGAVIKAELSSDEELLGEVVVEAEGNQEAEAIILLNQKQSLIATQGIGAIELSRKGIGNAEAAVAQISGVSKQEGQKNVFVRGLADRYNATTLNGFPLPSDDPEYKNISLDIFDTDMLQSVGVSKAFTASQTSEVGGAIINIESKKLVGDKLFQISADAGVNTSVLGNKFYRPDGTNYWGVSNREFVFEPGMEANDIPAGTPNPMSNSLNPNLVNTPIDHSFGIKAGKRFDFGSNKFLSLLLVGNHSIGNSFSNRISRTFNSIVSPLGVFESDQIGTISTTDTRQIVLGNAYLNLNNRHTVEYNFLGIHSNNQFVTISSGMGGETRDLEDEDGWTVYYENPRDNYLMVNQLISSWGLTDKLKFDIGASYSNVRAYEPDRRTLFLLRSNSGSTLENKETTWNIASQSKLFRYSDTMKENQLTAKAHFNWEYMDKSFLTLGYEYQMSNHDFVDRAANLIGDRTHTYSQDEILHIDFDKSIHYDESKNNGGMYDPNTSIYFEGQKHVHSPYIEINHTFSEQFSINLGLRADLIDQVTSYGENGLPKDKNGQILYDSVQFIRPLWLPSLNLKYAINDAHVLRLSASRTYSIPRFKEFSQYKYIGLDYTVLGWPWNKVSYIWNADLKYDWYLSVDEYLTAGIFYKNITDPMGRGFFGGSSGYLEYRTTANEANVAGAEIDFKKNVLNLYNAAKEERHKLTLGINASYLFSNLYLNFPLSGDPRDINSGFPKSNERYTQLEGASPWLANVDLTYTFTKGKRNYTAAILMSYYSDRIYGYGTIDMFKYDQVEIGIPKLNFVATADITDKLSAKLKINNILNPHYQTKQLANDQIQKGLKEANPNGQPIYNTPTDDFYEVSDSYNGVNFGEPFVVRDFRNGVSFSLGLSYKF